MWLFCASDLMFFVGLIGAFIVLREGNAGPFSDHEKGLSLGLAGAGVGAMMLSSVAAFAAVRGARAGSTIACGIGLLLTLLCGIAFIAFRSMEYAVSYGPGTDVFFAIWFTLTGAHLVHVACGLVAIIVLLIQLLRTKALPKQIHYVAMYWNFTVFIGVFLFALLYLS